MTELVQALTPVGVIIVVGLICLTAMVIAGMYAGRPRTRQKE